MPDSKPYKEGDIIGQKYEVAGVVGRGGFGIVYLVYSRETESVYALKTFRDEYLEDPDTRVLFRKEAQVWVDLERHPYLVRAYFVDEISGRLYITMEYIAPNEGCPNTLQGYLDRHPPDLAQSLRWAIQFCHGMEHAYSKGVRCHRDIKPGNIMISQDKVVKITDFGLAGVIGASKSVSGIQLNVYEDKIGLSTLTLAGQGIGTPYYMPPEQFYDVAYCDQKSDIYAFGVVLFQMATGGKLPFHPPPPKDNSQVEHLRFCQEIQRLHEQGSVPELSSPLFPMIHRCLEKMPEKRYPSFSELRSDLVPLLKKLNKEVIRLPEEKELEVWEWNNKGNSLAHLGRFEDAIRCYDKAIELDSLLAPNWYNKENCLNKLGRFEEAVRCCDKAIELDPQDAKAWNNKGKCLSHLGLFDESIQCFDKAIKIDPLFAIPWNNKGGILGDLGRYEEAILCCDKAIELDPHYANPWYNKGSILGKSGHFDQSIQCFDKAIEFAPLDEKAWHNKSATLGALGRLDEAIQCCDKALKIDPRFTNVWYLKAFTEEVLARDQNAVHSYKQFLSLAASQDADRVALARQRLKELESKA